MVPEILFLTVLIFGISVWMYRSAIHEFQILQKDYSSEHDWASLLEEQLPLVIRSLPKHWLGAWTRTNTRHKTWVVKVRDDEGRLFRTTWNHWLEEPVGIPENLEELATTAKLDTTIRHWNDDGFRRWFWLPPRTPVPSILLKPKGVVKTTAAVTTIVSTDGAPLELWIAHEGAIPANVADELRGENPWVLTTKEIPWIGEVKYIEVKLRPGNAITIPAHWWYALKSDEGQAWYWVAESQTLPSLFATFVTSFRSKKVRPETIEDDE